MSDFDVSKMSNEELQRRYWSMPLVTEEDDALSEAICIELINRHVTLNAALNFLVDMKAEDK